MPHAFNLRTSRASGTSELYPRTRLFRWLDAARAEHPIVWIAGPAGSGKTALIKSYLDFRGLPTLYYSVKASDANPLSFASSFSHPLLIDATRPTTGIATPTDLDHSIATLDDDAVADKPASHASQVVVLDGCEVLADDAAIFAYFAAGLERLTPGTTILFVSRHAPPPDFARLMIRREVAVLAWDELRLTPEESLGIARLRETRVRDQGSILQAHEKSTGWLAGFLLMLQELSPGRHRPGSVNHRAEKNIHDYFRSEIFARVDSMTQDFLMVTALLQGMTVPMMEQLTGDALTALRVAGLCHTHCFIDRHAQPSEVYQYHSLFRNFLLTEGRARFTPERLRVLQARAAQLLEQDGQCEAAALQLISARDWQSLVALVSRHVAVMLRQGRVQTIESWLHALPADYLAATPWGLYWLGLCHLHHCDRLGPNEFSRAYELFKVAGDREGILLAWAGAVDALLATHNYRALDPWMADLDEQLRHSPDLPSGNVEHRVTTSMFSALLHRCPGRIDRDAWHERLKNCLRESDDGTQTVAMARAALQYQVWFGTSAGCAVVVDRVRVIAQTAGQTPANVIQCGLIEATYLWFTASFGECLTSIRSSLDIAAESGLHRWDNELYGLGVCANIGLSRYPEAQDWLQKMSMTLYLRCRHDAGQYHYLSAWCEMARGDTVGAFEHANAAHRIFSLGGGVLDIALADGCLAQLSFERSEWHDARQSLDALRAAVTATGSPHLEFVCHLIHFSQENGKAAKGRSRNILSRLFALGSRHDYQNSCWWQRRLVAQAAVMALSMSIDVEYVQSLVRRHDLTLDNPPFAVERWPWPIKIHTLGRFSLLKYDQPLWASRKAQHKPLEMLKVLIAYGGREVSVDLIAAVLWPDAEGDAAHNSFEITLHRLRKLIGMDRILLLRDGRLTLDSRYCWVDTWALERLIGQIDLALRSERQDDEFIMQSSATVLGLYQGHYLGKEYAQPWALTLRERLRSKYLRHVTDMTHYLEKQQRWQEAIVYYQKGLEVDDLAEQFYQSFMICYQRLGRRSEALAVYRRCRSALSIILGIEPSPATESIRKSLAL